MVLFSTAQFGADIDCGGGCSRNHDKQDAALGLLPGLRQTKKWERDVASTNLLQAGPKHPEGCVIDVRWLPLSEHIL